MKNVDVEIYLNQLISFFEKNPNDLINLIGDSLKDEFYNRVRKQSLDNIENGDDVTLTQKQIIDIVVGLKQDEIKKGKSVIIHEVFEQNRVGVFCLN
jgi:hypothetical protein